ncbi:LPS export ABC transporter periplasmic protein LptC [Ramlibacter sp. H39-3-26]|uniref:LPS export ABC transporter periplasmic protein LptC n=1 Tax=Curvibacter soli TaxID=3031331 RepID=UPI0023DCA70C|nr:LPS export ABC transporter periplasmic protein LptC [Ramlibacter sp. H39-3-26]MDF1486315.1 LPS export ABC transporter periplasmic protein LptC [Ramlibacter sp. H39-3-26]
MTLLQRLHGAWERASIYLPALLMGVLALGTYWLVRSTPSYSVPEAPRAVRHEPDYFLRSFSVKSFDPTGRLKNEVFGDEARHYPDNDTLEIDDVRIRAYDLQGHLTLITARRGLSNGDGSEVQLFGNAVVTREAMQDPHGQEQPRMELRSEFLHAFMNTEEVRTHLPVVITRGADRFTADSLHLFNLDQVIELRGRVRGLMHPLAAEPKKR